MDWDNRLDLGLQARWNVTEFLTLKDRRRLNQSKIQQAHLAHDDLRAKLTAGVYEARGAIWSGDEQIKLAEQQIRDARQAHELSKQRLLNLIENSSSTEVILALRSLAGAQLNYITAVSSYNKAQLRLLVLTGEASGHHCH